MLYNPTVEGRDGFTRLWLFRILRSIEISVCFLIVYPNDQISARAVNKQESRLYSDSTTQLLFLPVPMAVLPTVSFGNSTTKFQNRVTVRISVTPFNVFIRFWPNCPLVARPSKKIYTLEHFCWLLEAFFPNNKQICDGMIGQRCRFATSAATIKGF